MHWIKIVHVSCVVLSFLAFSIRGIWMLNESPLLNKRWVKIFPHIIDASLLVSALALIYVMSLPVLQSNWLLAKIIALIIYIVIGSVALKWGRTKKVRMFAFFLALIVFLFIVSVAMTKSVSGLLSIL